MALPVWSSDGPSTDSGQLAVSDAGEVAAGPKRTALRLAQGVVRRFVALSSHERYLLALALPTVVMMRVALYVLPLRWLLRRVLGRAISSRPLGGPAEPVLVGRAVHRVARVVPRATCLTQSLATLWMLAGRGHAGTMRVGVKRGSDGGLLAHAWVEHGTRIVIGRDGVDEYAVMPGLEGALRLR
jgi:hypothetical protein